MYTKNTKLDKNAFFSKNSKIKIDIKKCSIILLIRNTKIILFWNIVILMNKYLNLFKKIFISLIIMKRVEKFSGQNKNNNEKIFGKLWINSVCNRQR